MDIVKPMIDDKLLLYNPSLSQQLQDILSFHADYKTMVAAIGYSVDMNIISKGADIPISAIE